MKRQVFQIKNQLHVSRYLYIVAFIAVLTVLFLTIANLERIAAMLGLNTQSEAQDQLNLFNEGDADSRIEQLKDNASSTTGNTIEVVLYDPEEDAAFIRSELELMKQNYAAVSSLSSVEDTATLLVIDADALSEADTAELARLKAQGISLLFSGIPNEGNLSLSLRELLGIQTIGQVENWPGLRTSEQLYTGTLQEEPEIGIRAYDIRLKENTKVYACALPEEVEEEEQSELPPLAWRYISDDSGYVYVLNGDESEYGMLSVALSEINGSYIYPVVNACCVSVTGFPYVNNDTRDSWTRLYGRDKIGIQRDMLYTQLKRYIDLYDVKLTCFSEEYDELMADEDNYFVTDILSNSGFIADCRNGKYSLGSGMEANLVEDWQPDFSFIDLEDGSLKLPICFNSTIEDAAPASLEVSRMAGVFGYYALNVDYLDFLSYDGEKDIWTAYCKDQQSGLGNLDEKYGWLDRVTLPEAFARLLQLYQSDISVQYSDTEIAVTVESSDDEGCFLLRTAHAKPTIDNGSIEQLGTNCYFVTVKGDSAVISWEEN